MKPQNFRPLDGAIRIPVLVLAVTLLHVSPASTQDRGADASVIVLKGGTLIDGMGATPRKDVEVVIRGNQIAEIGPKGSLKYPGSARVIVTDNKYILPGLIDSHVHYDDWVAELFLYYGVTTVADMGNFGHWILEMRRQINAGKIVGPRLYSSGNSINRAPIQGPGVQHQLGVNSSEQAADVAQQLQKQGVNHFKVYARMTPELIGAVARVAHTHDMRVHGHIGISAAEAVQSGLDVLEHASGVAEATAPPEELAALAARGLTNAENLMDASRYDALIRTMVDRKVFITPTLVFYGGGVHAHVGDYRREDLEFLKNPDVRYFPPNPIRRYHAVLDARAPEEAERLKVGYQKLQDFLRRFHHAGGMLLAGSDVAQRGIPGLMLHREMQLFVDTGLTPMEAIQAATRNGAIAVGQEKSLGTVEPGKLADLFIVNADPLSEITNTQKIEFVIKDGRVLDHKLHSDFTNPLPRPVPSFPSTLPPY